MYSQHRWSSSTGGHGQEFVPWPENDGYWILVPVVEAVTR